MLRLSTGFTLIEVLLAISVFSMLAAVVTINMFGGVRERYLDEGSQQFETLIRMARAEAANQGRRMRIAWRSEDERIVVMWEPQPLAQPGEFVEHTGASWAGLVPNEMVRIVGVQRDDVDAKALVFDQSSAVAGVDEVAEQTLIEFFPDGSCDSATIQIASRDEADNRRAVVELDGVNYLISTLIMGPTELAQWQENISAMQTSNPSGY